MWTESERREIELEGVARRTLVTPSSYMSVGYVVAGREVTSNPVLPGRLRREAGSVYDAQTGRTMLWRK